MGQSRGIDDDQIQRKRTPSFPNHESIVSRNAQKQRRWEAKEVGNYRYTSVSMGIRLKLFFALRTIISSVSAEQSQMCVRNTVPVKQDSGDPYWQDSLTPVFVPATILITTITLLIEIPAQENLLHKYKERVGRLPQQDRLIKICTDVGFLKTVEVGPYFVTKHTD